MRLLVSVIDADEATAAVGGGAHLIDVKNPGEGALGAGAVGVRSAACTGGDRVGGRVAEAAVSAALRRLDRPVTAVYL
jgi:uncharacterized protein (UPF0264 family)